MRFLSDAWLEALDQAARSHTGPGPGPDGAGSALAGVRVRIEHSIEDGPRWQLVIDDGVLRVQRNPSETPTVRLHSDRVTAAAIASGSRPALQAFVAGDLTVSGDVAALMRHRAALETLGDLFASVRDDTDWS